MGDLITEYTERLEQQVKHPLRSLARRLTV